MAAATTTRDGAAKDKILYRLFSNAKRFASGNRENPDYMFLPFDSGNITPLSTETDDVGDEIRVIQFPQGFKLVDLQVVSTADVDTGTGTLVYDVISDDGTTETVLISGCTVGATATGKDELDRNQGNMLLDVGGDWLSVKITTAANANAGTGVIRFKGYGFQGSLPNPNA